jgi:hypothetical protein
MPIKKVPIIFPNTNSKIRTMLLKPFHTNPTELAMPIPLLLINLTNLTKLARPPLLKCNPGVEERGQKVGQID